MKKLLYFILPLLLLSCTKDDSFTSKDDLSSLSIVLSLNDFQLFVDNGTTSKGGLTKKDSDFVNVFFDEVIINFQSVPSGFETDLTINPNDLENSDEVVLPLGTYSWTITNQTTDEISNRLSVYGSGTLDVKEPNISIDLLVETDYSLITVQKKYVSSSILKYGNLTVNMESNDDYYFGYIKSETDGITLEVVDNVYNSTIETVLEDILKCKHYSYLLDYSTVKTQSVSLVCSPMEVIENYLIPNNSLEVGKTIYGGKIFYLFKEGDSDYVEGETHGLIVALEDIGETRFTTGNLGNFNTDVDVTTYSDSTNGSDIGKGYDNCNNLISYKNNNGLSGSFSAIELSISSELQGYQDWYLPSIGELILIRNNLDLRNTLGFTNDKYYWSSSLMDNKVGAVSLKMSVNSGGFCGCAFFESYKIRPIRKF